MQYHKISYIFFPIIILLLLPNNLISGQDDSNLTLLADSSTITKNNDLTENTSITDKDSTENNYIPLSQFFYADNPRYTISGEPALKETEIKPLRTIAFGTGFAGILVAQHIFQLRTLWDTLVPFKFAEDIKQDLWADKAGHFFDSYIASYLIRDMLVECGFSNDASAIWGSVMGWSYLNYIEILDGFGKNWGFSPSDFYANTAGALYFIGQHYFPVLQNFTPKFTYIPANLHGELQRAPHSVFIDDYSSHTNWISVNVHNLLPESMKKYWLPWLQLSFGYAARNLMAYDVYSQAGNTKIIDKYKPVTEIKRYEVWGSPRFIIALDYDLVKIFPNKGTFWNWLAQTLNYYKLPSPAVEFSYKKPRYYLVYPF